MIYADYASTAPMKESAKAEYIDCMDIIGNPSSIHRAGRIAAEKIIKARQTVAELINCHPSEVFFTSGGTESDNWAISQASSGLSMIVTSTFEHHAIINAAKEAEKKCSVLVRWVTPEPNGIVNPYEVAERVRQRSHNGVNLVSIMTANNEIGTIQPIADIVRESKKNSGNDIIFHTDAVQAVGHIPVDVQAMGVDMLSLSGHKFGGPKGVGAMYCNRKAQLRPFMFGGGQEMGRRPGTENVAAIASMAVAMRESCEALLTDQSVKRVRDLALSRIMEMKGAHINGDINSRLPGNLNCRFDDVEGETLVLLLSASGICVSAGSACSSGNGKPSHVLTGIGQTPEEAFGAIRISFGEHNTEKDAELISEKIAEGVNLIRAGRR